jgi:uncharacterized protein (UPF0548 family)
MIAREPPGIPQRDGPFRRAAAAILRYDVFEPSTLTPVIGRAPLEVGDTVGARYHLPLGIDLFFASRVIEVFDGGDANVYRAGFTYRTLAGHPELGEETFAVEKDMDSGDITVALRSWSRPGLLATRLGWPVARRIQVSASKEALEHLEQRAREP